MLLISLVLCSCGYGRPVTTDEYILRDENRLWLDDENSLGQSHSDNVYIIGKNDLISINIRDHEEFNGDLIVNENGDVRLPLLDEFLHVAGLSLRQTEDVLSHYLKPYTKNEMLIHVDLINSGSRFYYLVGSKVGMGNRIVKIPLGVTPVYLRELSLGTEADIQLDEIKIVKPDFTDKNNPLFTTVDMSGVSKGYWGTDYRIRPNDMVVFQQKFYVKLQSILELFTDQMEDVRETDSLMFDSASYLEDRLRNSRHFKFAGPKQGNE